MKETPAERTFYRTIERIGDKFEIILELHQQFLVDGAPGKKQITFGISTGINNIPTALTIQKGNAQDKTHFDHIFKTVTKVLGEGSINISNEVISILGDFIKKYEDNSLKLRW